MGGVRKGFTIVELLIVVVVIAILAAITIVSYNGITKQAREARMLAEVSQIQKSIQVDAMTSSGQPSSVGKPLVYTTEAEKQILFTKPMSSTQEVTMYLVVDTTTSAGTDWSSYMYLQPMVTSSAHLSLRHSTGSSMGSRLDTSAQTNSTSTITAGAISTTPGRHIGWISTQPTKYEVNFDSSAAAVTNNILPHTGWNFSSVYMRSNSSKQAVAGLVFDEYHDAKTRKHVMQWLDKKHDIGFYNE